MTDIWAVEAADMVFFLTADDFDVTGNFDFADDCVKNPK
jgi:hypothetical protein